MSFEEKLLQTTSAFINNFLDTISTKYDLDRDELQSIWSKNGKTKVKTEKSSVDLDDLSPERSRK